MRQYRFFLKNIVLHKRTLLIGFRRFNFPISFDVPTQIFQQLTQLGVFSSTFVWCKFKIVYFHFGFAMSKPFNNPNLLTKDRLKRELESNGIKLPRGDQKKDVYVKLYEENVSPKSVGRRLGNREFSSDEDYEVESEQTKVYCTSELPKTVRSFFTRLLEELLSAYVNEIMYIRSIIPIFKQEINYVHTSVNTALTN